MLVLDSKHSFIGSTPERLYSRYGTELDTEALAGTIGRGKRDRRYGVSQLAFSNSKNLNENQYVVDDIGERLLLILKRYTLKKRRDLCVCVRCSTSSVIFTLNSILALTVCSCLRHYNQQLPLRVTS